MRGAVHYLNSQSVGKTERERQNTHRVNAQYLYFIRHGVAKPCLRPASGDGQCVRMSCAPCIECNGGSNRVVAGNCRRAYRQSERARCFILERNIDAGIRNCGE